MKKILVLGILLFHLLYSAEAQKVEPPFWWVGMENNELQLLVYSKDVARLKVKIDYPGVEVKKVHKFDNPNYLAIDLIISSETKVGSFNIDFFNSTKKVHQYKYELKKRAKKSANRKGFGQEDVIYLLMPDRFSNGDPKNDNVDAMLEKANRANPDGRHGGDLQGISNHLDYFSQLGVSALWINPVLENNMPAYSYHGYAITDFYKVDARFGSNQDYVDMVAKAKSKNIKIIMDMVFNHCGSKHWWLNDLPSNDWLHQFDEFTRSNYRGEALMDPHASEYDKMIMSHGWFDHSMPDLNQKNPFLANYLIQNSIWWIEYADLGGIRMDTYPYADQEFMNAWVNAVYTEYPDFNIVGEAWLQTVAHTAYFQNNTFANTKAPSKLNTVTDFPLCYAANDAFNQQDSWTNGVARLYMTLSQDFVYSNADSNVIFLENHDIDRFASNVANDMAKWKMGMTFLLTTRGIPMLYYGGEFMMPGKKGEGDAALRIDFPGGWQGDSIDVFNNKNLPENQQLALHFTKSLLELRNANPALQTGKLTHYIPKDGYYVYFRSDGNKAFMIAMNNGEEVIDLDLSEFAESLKPFLSIRKFGEESFSEIPQEVQLPIKSAVIFELIK